MTSTLPLRKALDAYLAGLAEAGAVSPQVLAPALPEHIAALGALEGVTLPDPFQAFLARVGSYDRERCRALGVREPDFANGMFVIAARFVPKHYQSAGLFDDPDHWPIGLVPFLWGGSGDFTAINCASGSPDYGAVYDVDEAYGATNGPMDSDLVAFLLRSGRELSQGRRLFQTPTLSVLAVHRRP